MKLHKETLPPQKRRLRVGLLIPTYLLATTIGIMAYLVGFTIAALTAQAHGGDVGVFLFVLCVTPIPTYLMLFHPGEGRLWDRLIFRNLFRRSNADRAE